MMLNPAQAEVICEFERLPFHLGASSTPHNQGEFPDVCPFTLAIDHRLGLLVQKPLGFIDELLQRAYRNGSILGTAMDESVIGKRYTEDFLNFITSNISHDLTGVRVLEIGAGRGYLLRRLRDLGASVVGVEPGLANLSNWKQHDVDVIADYFPSPQLPGPFDIIVAYAVLEHISNPDGFLQHVKEHIAENGLLIVAVPDCGPYIKYGEPSMLIHQHYLYFTDKTLRRLLGWSGFEVSCQASSKYGGSLYAIAGRCESVKAGQATHTEIEESRHFGAQLRVFQAQFLQCLDNAAAKNTSVGLFAPSRAIALLPEDAVVRFFDDDPELTGKYYPPFATPIENRGSLMRNPPDEVWIMSRTFGRRLKEELSQQQELRHVVIKTIDEIVHVQA